MAVPKKPPGRWLDDDNIAPAKLAPATIAPAPIGFLGDLLGPALDRAERRRSGEELPIGTPWPQLNETLGGGFWPGSHFLVAGTGVGKSQWTFQLALHAAKQGAPTGLIALELDEMSLAIRIASEEAGVSWSRVYNGKASAEEMARLRAVLPSVAKHPVRTDFGQAMGWSVDRLELMAKELRAMKKKGPICIVLDFIQLIAQRPGEKPIDLRERIGAAGYQARNIAKNYDAAILIISSTARNNYAALSQKMSKAGLGMDRDHTGALKRAVWYPDQLIGLGKESGELEFAADSLHTFLRPPITEGTGDQVVKTIVSRGGKIVVCATPKMRAGSPSWFAMAFEKGRFISLEESTINSLAQTQEEADEDEFETVRLASDKVLEYIVAADPMNGPRSSRDVAKAVGIRERTCRAALTYLEDEKKIYKVTKTSPYTAVKAL